MTDAIILAGGLGTRLRSVVSEVPKCMAPVAGKPFLKYLLDWLAGQDTGRVILSVGYLHEVIVNWIGEHRSEWPFEICFAIEHEPLGTGGGIRLALQQANSDSVLILNGDTFFDIDFQALRHALLQRGKPLTLALKPMEDFDRYGTVECLPDGTLLRFNEKKPCRKGLINGGIYLMEKNAPVFDGLPERFSFEKDVLEPLCAKGLLDGYPFDGYFIDIGVPDDYRRAEVSLPALFPNSLPAVDASRYGTLLLDRDGVINVLLPGDYVKRWEEFHFLPGVPEMLAKWTAQGKRLFIVTNQRGVGKGLMSQQDLDDIHRQMCALIGRAGGRIDGIYTCTDVDENSPRRKPQTGLFLELLKDHPDIRPEDCLMIGDSASDMEFARNCGIRGIRIRS